MIKFVLLLSGPPCSGKSTLRRSWFEHNPSTYHLGYDNLKWHLSDYHRDKHAHLIKELLFRSFEAACEVMQRPIFLEAYMKDEKDYERYCSIAADADYKVVCVTLSAPRDTLIQRFRDRVASAAKAGNRISITDEKLYLQNLDSPLFTPTDGPTIDSGVLDQKEVFERVHQEIEKQVGSLK